MVDVPLRHRRAQRIPPPPPATPLWRRPVVLLPGAILAILLAGVLFKVAIETYRAHLTLTGLTADPTPVALLIGGEPLAVPANMLRFAETRAGGAVARADLALHWPDLDGYSEESADAFKDGSPTAPVVYATIAPRDTPLDLTGRLDDVYARFFVDKPVAGPAGLVGRRLNKESGYENEVVYFVPSEQRPFVARCLPKTTDAIPATCLRDVNFGKNLSILYRFNRNLLGDWQALDGGILKRANGFLTP